MKAAQRIERLRALMAEAGIDAYLVRSVTDLIWLTGFSGVFDSEEAHCAFISADACILHTDMRYSTALRERAADEALWEIDDERIGVSGFVARCLAEANSEAAVVAIDAMTPLKLYRALVDKLPKARLLEREDDILSLRSIKDADELACLRTAMDITARAFTELLDEVRPGLSERELSLELEIALRRCGADELSFPNIVASGPNSANPHAVPSDRVLEPGDFVVFDFGACKDGYRADTTRTIFLGSPDDEQRRVYEAVREANEVVRQALHAGVTGKAMHELAEEHLADAGYANKMGHALGHGLGLDVHELPTLSPANDSALPVGSVVTVEPGIYLPGRYGVRIEDFGSVGEDSFVDFCGLSNDLLIVG